MTVTNTRFNQGKPPLGTLVAENPNGIELLSYVQAYATIKYGIPTGFLYLPGTHEEGQTTLYNSAMRHLSRPFDLDGEMKVPHIVPVLTEVTLFRERALKKQLGDDIYVDQTKLLFGEDDFKKRNEEAMKVKDPAVWAQRWNDMRQDMLRDPTKIPIARILPCTHLAMEQIAHAQKEYHDHKIELTELEKFEKIGHTLICDHDYKIFPEQQVNSFDMAGYLLLNLIQHKYPEPKIFLQ